VDDNMNKITIKNNGGYTIIKNEDVHRYLNKFGIEALEYTLNVINASRIREDKDSIDEITVAIPLEYYEELLYCERKLDALEYGGVDNWSGYGDAMQEYFYNDED
jgi:hypothetical protein